MLALKVASPEQDLGFLCSHAGACLTSALIPHLENPWPSESELERACLELNSGGECRLLRLSCAIPDRQLRVSQSFLLLTLVH